MKWHVELTIFIAPENELEEKCRALSAAYGQSLHDRETLMGSQAQHQMGDGETIDAALSAAIKDAVGDGLPDVLVLVGGRIFATTKHVEMDAVYIAKKK